MQDVRTQLVDTNLQFDTPTEVSLNRTVPALREPILVTHAQATYTDKEEVIICYFKSAIYVCSLDIIRKHLIVYILHENNWYSLTYCPYTKTAIGYLDRWLFSGKTYKNNITLLGWKSLEVSKRPNGYSINEAIHIVQLFGSSIDGLKVYPRFPLRIALWSDIKNEKTTLIRVISHKSIGKFLNKLIPEPDTVVEELVKCVYLFEQKKCIGINRCNGVNIGRSELYDFRERNLVISAVPDINYRDLNICVKHNGQVYHLSPSKIQACTREETKFFCFDIPYANWVKFFPSELYFDHVIPPFDVYDIERRVVNCSDNFTEFFTYGNGMNPGIFPIIIEENRVIVVSPPRIQYIKRLFMLFALSCMRGYTSEIWKSIFRQFSGIIGGIDLNWNRFKETLLEKEELFLPNVLPDYISLMESWFQDLSRRDDFSDRKDLSLT